MVSRLLATVVFSFLSFSLNALSAEGVLPVKEVPLFGGNSGGGGGGKEFQLVMNKTAKKSAVIEEWIGKNNLRVQKKKIKESIDYTNCIAEIPVGRQRKEFLEWLNKEAK